MINIAMTKGRLEKLTIARLNLAGIDTRPLTEKGRKLVVDIGDKYRVVFAKAADVVTYVEYGVSDVGIVGKDTLMEMDAMVYELLDLGFGCCRFAIATMDGTDIYKGYNQKTIATKYPNVAKRFFQAKNMDVKIVKIEGSVELAPILKLADAIVDIVETGATIKENGLAVVEYIADISARLIANTASLKAKTAQINDLVDILRG